MGLIDGIAQHPLAAGAAGLGVVGGLVGGAVFSYGWTKGQFKDVKADFTTPEGQDQMEQKLIDHAAFAWPVGIASIVGSTLLLAKSSASGGVAGVLAGATGIGVGTGILLGEKLGSMVGLSELHKTVTVVQQVHVLGDLGDGIAAAPGAIVDAGSHVVNEISRVPGGVADHVGGAVNGVGGFLGDVVDGGKLPWEK